MNRFLTRNALSLYTSKTAEAYRRSDDEYKAHVGEGGKFAFVERLRKKFDDSVLVADLGCGTGRYHHIFRESDSIIGIDVNATMLNQARNPVGGLKAKQSLWEADIQTVDLPAENVSIVLCMGVFGSQMPLTINMARKVFYCLKPQGTFAFDVIKSFDRLAETLKSTIARRVQPCTFGALRQWFDAKLMGFTLDERQAGCILERAGFTTWTFEQIRGRGRDDLLVEAKKV